MNEILGWLIGFIITVCVIFGLLCLGYYARGDSLEWVYEGCDELAFHNAQSQVESYRFSDHACIMKNGQIWKWTDGHAEQIEMS